VSLTALAGIILVVFSAVLLVGLYLLKDRVKASFRTIPAFTEFIRSIGTAVEQGTRVHFSLGSADVSRERTGASFVGLSVVRHVAELAAAGDKPPVTTSGNAALAVLSQDSLQSAYRAAGMDEQYDPNTGRVTGLTPFSYAAGALSMVTDEDVSSSLLAGGFGSEIGLLTEAVERQDAFTLSAADSLPAQALVYASAKEPLIGEELYAMGAYLKTGRIHEMSLYVQDVLRWLIVLVLLGGAVMKLLAGLV
jgi:hypothetical protein